MPTKARALRISRWKFSSTTHLCDLPRGGDHDSTFELPDRSWEAGRPLKRSSCPNGCSRDDSDCPAYELADTADCFAASSTAVPPVCVPPHLADAGVGFAVATSLIRAFQLGIPAGCALSRFDQQGAQQGVALLADRPQPSPPGAGVFARDQSQIAGQLLAVGKALDISDHQHEGQCRDRTHAGARAQQLRARVPLAGRLHRPTEFDNGRFQPLQQEQQIASAPLGPGLQLQLQQPLTSALGPQLPFFLQPLVQSHMLQLILDASPHLHQLVAMQQQLPQIALLRTRHPDGGELSDLQQLQQMIGVALVVFLLAHRSRPNASGVTDEQFMSQLPQQALEPAGVAAGLDAHAHGLSLQAAVELFRFARGMVEFLSHSLLGLLIQHGNLLEARMKITAYNLHCGSFRPSSLVFCKLKITRRGMEPSLLSNQAKRGICSSPRTADPSPSAPLRVGDDIISKGRLLISPDKFPSADPASIRPAPGVDTSRHRDDPVSLPGNNPCFRQSAQSATDWS